MANMFGGGKPSAKKGGATPPKFPVRVKAKATPEEEPDEQDPNEQEEEGTPMEDLGNALADVRSALEDGDTEAALTALDAADSAYDKCSMNESE